MQNWRLRFLGIDSIPGWLGELEIEQFFTLTASEIATVRSRRGETLQLGLALHIGFLRMAGCVLNGTNALPKRLLAFLGAQLNIKVPRVTSVRALYRRRRTLHEHQQLAQAVLGIRTLPPQAESHLVSHLRRSATGVTQPVELLGPARAWLYEQVDFTRNLFARMNRELGSDIDLSVVEHVARYDPLSDQVDIHARFARKQIVRVESLGRSFAIAEGEMVLTEISRKYHLETCLPSLEGFGFETEAVFTDERNWFALILLKRTDSLSKSRERRM